MRASVPPGPGEVHLWLAAPEECAAAAPAHRYHDLLAEGERERHARFVSAAHGCQFLAARVLLRVVLSGYAGGDPRRWEFTANAYGRPEIAFPHAGGLRFNVSHTEGLVACAVAFGSDVGVDVEDAGRRLDRYLQVAETVLAPDELRDLHATPEPGRRDRFFGYWTLKEAYAKARGMGFSLPFTEISFRLCPRGGVTGVSFAPPVGDDPAGWRFAAFRDGARHRGAVALRCAAGTDLRVTAWRTVPLRWMDSLQLEMVGGE